jgi:hypothetical protein
MRYDINNPDRYDINNPDRYKSGLRVIMVRRQIENHLRFLRLEREMAYDSYRNLERDKPSSVS